MSSIKITDLPVLTTPSANGSNTVFVVVDKSSGTYTTKQLTLGNLDISLDNVAPVAWAHANAAFDKANSANVVAQAGFDKANTVGTTAQAAFDKANSANVVAQGGFDKANSANVLAQQAFNQANTANSTDYTTISTTAGVYGNATHVAVVTVEANGRVSSITNTAITGFANATFAQAAYDAANTEIIGSAAFDKANSANVLAQQAYDAANTNGATFNSYAANTANAAWLTANAAFVQANAANSLAANAVAKTGSTMTGDLTITSANLVITGTGSRGTANIAGKLTIGATGYTPLPNLIAQFSAFTASYSQINQQNLDGVGSGDIVVTADNGDDGNNYIDMGMAGSSYNDPIFPAYLPNDGWLIVQGKEGQGYGGNLMLGTSASNTDILFLQGGTSFDEEVARFVHGEGLVLKYNTTSTSNSTGTLVVQGGIGANGNVYADAVYASGTNLLTRIQTVYDYANVVYDYANTISVSLSNQFITNASNTANAASVHANGAYDTANTTLATSALAFNTANTAQVTGTSAFVQANSAYDKANSANVLAQQAYDSSNTNFSSVSNIATPAFAHANGAFDKANSANTLAQAAYDQANTAVSGYAQANTATTIAQGAFDFANTVNTYAYSAYSVANTNATNISALSTRTNSAYDVANTALSTAALAINYDNQANGAFDKANSAYDQANTGTTLAGVAFTRGNTAYDQANTATTLAQNAYDSSNTVLTLANTTANTVANLANAIIYVGTAPANNKGTTGDTTGMVYLANNYFYYCTADYDGTTNVWSRISATDAW